MEQVEKGTQQEQPIGQEAEHVRPVLREEQKADDREKAEQDEPAPGT